MYFGAFPRAHEIVERGEAAIRRHGRERNDATPHVRGTECYSETPAPRGCKVCHTTIVSRSAARVMPV
jgi:hypothetical protein